VGDALEVAIEESLDAMTRRTDLFVDLVAATDARCVERLEGTQVVEAILERVDLIVTRIGDRGEGAAGYEGASACLKRGGGW
jgi:class 3 adenylate cyclase